MDNRLEAFMREHMPKEKQTLSRDAVEILMKLLWQEAHKAKGVDDGEDEFERLHGPRWI